MLPFCPVFENDICTFVNITVKIQNCFLVIKSKLNIFILFVVLYCVYIMHEFRICNNNLRVICIACTEYKDLILRALEI